MMKIVFISFIFSSLVSAQIGTDGGPSRNAGEAEIRCEGEDRISQKLEQKILDEYAQGERKHIFDVLTYLASNEVKAEPKLVAYVVDSSIQCNCVDDNLLPLARLWEYQMNKVSKCEQFEERVKHLHILKKVIKKKGLNYKDYIRSAQKLK